MTDGTHKCCGRSWIDGCACPDEEIERTHGDHKTYSIARWHEETKTGATNLSYVDWRADKLYWEKEKS